MKITVHLTRKEYHDAVAFLTRNEINQFKKTRYSIIINTLVVISYIPAIFILLIISTNSTGAVIFYVFSIVCPFFFGKLGEKLYRKYWEKLPQKPESIYGPKEYELIETGVKSQWSYGTSEISWSAVSGIIRLKDLTLILVDGYSAYIFPQRCFRTPQEHEEFYCKVKAFIDS